MKDLDLLKLIGHASEQDIMAAENLSAKGQEKGNRTMMKNDNTGNTPGKYVKKKHSLKFMLIAAALTVSLLGICAAAGAFYQHSLINNLKNHSLENPEGYEQLLVTAPQTENAEAADSNGDSELQPLVSGKDDVAEYQVLEAIIDSESLYTHCMIRPLQDDVMFIDQWVEPDSPVDFLENPEITGDMTVQQYADSVGKRLVYARLVENFKDEIINGWGTWAMTDKDGSIHYYGSGDNPSTNKKLPMSFEGFTYELDAKGPFLDRTVLEFTFEDKSSSDEVVYKHFRAYDPKSPDLQKDLGIVIDSLVMKRTELGIYATFTYHPTEEMLKQAEKELQEYQKENPDWTAQDVYKNFHVAMFSVLDENGEYFKVLGPSGRSSVVDNGDGTYSFTDSLASMESTDNLKFRVITAAFEKVGTYAFSR